MKWILGALSGLVLMGAVPGAFAAPIVFNFGTEFSGTGAVLSGPVVVTIDDGGGTGSVNVTVDATGLDGTLTEYISGLYLNLNPAIDPTTLGYSFPDGNSNPRVTALTFGTNCCKADGDGLYDIVIDWATSGFRRLQAGEVDVVNFTLAGLTAADFDFLSAPAGPGNNAGPFKAALRVRSMGADGENSGWFRPDDGQDLPEPGAILLFGLGLLGLSVMYRRKA